MSQELWTAVDKYFAEKLLQADPVLEEAQKASEAAGLPPIAVTPHQGKLLHLLTRMMGARSILEIGTLGGYSTIWMARALPANGKIVTLEYSEKHARVARSNLARAGVAEKVEVIVGPALESLPKLAAAGRGPFDLFFIDADKPSNADYFQWAMKLSRPESLIILDNVVRKGAVADPSTADEEAKGVRRCMDAMAKEKRFTATAIQTVCSKGYDGLAIGIVGA